jgi:hypothetical protein
MAAPLSLWVQVGSTAVTVVPPRPDSISKSPFSWRTLSRIPWIPTPDLKSDFSSVVKPGIPPPLSCIWTLTVCGL